jgi:lysophospholipase L1-like esterase
MRLRSAALPALAAALTVASTVPAPGQTPSRIDFTLYMSLGDSLAAGTVSSSLVVTHQRNSVPALIARQARVPAFEQPLVSEPGIPAELTLVSLAPTPVIQPRSTTPGAPTNLGLARPYNNVAVPGATSVDALMKSADDPAAVVRYHDLILRGRGTQVQQIAGSRPTFVTVWIGNNDVLGAAVRGRAVDGVTLTPAPVFRQVYGQIITALKATGAQIVAANLPDVTSIPYVRTIPPFLTDPATGRPVALLGPNGPLPQNAYVTLAATTFLARRDGIPTALGGTGAPLPDEVILDPAEVAVIQERVTANNQAIREICSAAGVPVLDLHGLLDELATTGRTVGGVTLTSAFLTGGVFSYDGVHPTDLGYAVVANEWIRVINENGGDLPPVNLGPFLGVAATAAGATSRPVWAEFTPEAQAALLAMFPRLDGR